MIDRRSFDKEIALQAQKMVLRSTLEVLLFPLVSRESVQS